MQIILKSTDKFQNFGISNVYITILLTRDSYINTFFLLTNISWEKIYLNAADVD